MAHFLLGNGKYFSVSSHLLMSFYVLDITINYAVKFFVSFALLSGSRILDPSLAVDDHTMVSGVHSEGPAFVLHNIEHCVLSPPPIP